MEYPKCSKKHPDGHVICDLCYFPLGFLAYLIKKGGRNERKKGY